MSTDPDKSDAHPAAKWLAWTEGPKAASYTFWGLGITCAGLALFSFFYHMHGYFNFEEWPNFYGWYGFGALVVVVLMGWPMRRLFARPEDYYDQPEEDEDV